MASKEKIAEALSTISAYCKMVQDGEIEVTENLKRQLDKATWIREFQDSMSVDRFTQEVYLLVISAQLREMTFSGLTEDEAEVQLSNIAKNAVFLGKQIVDAAYVEEGINE